MLSKNTREKHSFTNGGGCVTKSRGAAVLWPSSGVGREGEVKGKGRDGGRRWTLEVGVCFLLAPQLSQLTHRPLRRTSSYARGMGSNPKWTNSGAHSDARSKSESACGTLLFPTKISSAIKLATFRRVNFASTAGLIPITHLSSFMNDD